MRFSSASVSDSFFGGFERVENSIFVPLPTETAQPIAHSRMEGAE